MTDGDEMIARHQRVREFVEQRHPTCFVTEIVERAKTEYQRNLAEGKFVFAGGSIVFTVETIGRDRTLPFWYCDIEMGDDERLHILREEVFKLYP